jgi:hypothetical protein
MEIDTSIPPVDPSDFPTNPVTSPPPVISPPDTPSNPLPAAE